MRHPAALCTALLLTLACSGNDDGRYTATQAYVYGAEAQVRMPLPDSIVTEQGDILRRSLLLRGDSIYHGLAARGTCSMCHGNHGRGGPIGRDFTDNEWSHIDGSWNRIQGLIIGGVEYDPPMPPFGGASFTEDDVRAVAAYVYWLSRRDGHPVRSEAAPPAAPDADGDEVPGAAPGDAPETENGA